ncbi:hypothetical protein BX667DRAFT_498322 [Coemansia mojavensis]|nr:hypothetical protein BX667DRAFT_498322 [Coemansia mojavensis]
MDHFSALPYDIHSMIISRLYNDYKGSWRLEKSLLAINRTWRYLALPLVFNRAYIIHGKPKTRSDTRCPIFTNIDLISNSMKVIKEISIEMHYNEDPLPGFEKIVKLLGCDTKRLEFSLDPTKYYAEDQSKIEIHIADLATRFAIALPSLNELEYKGKDLQAARVFMRCIVPLYADKLESLKSSIPFSATCELTQLKKTIRSNRQYKLGHFPIWC